MSDLAAQRTTALPFLSACVVVGTAFASAHAAPSNPSMTSGRVVTSQPLLQPVTVERRVCQPVAGASSEACGLQQVVEYRKQGYQVVYEVDGRQYTSHMRSNPGPTVALQWVTIDQPGQPASRVPVPAPSPVAAPLVRAEPAMSAPVAPESVPAPAATVVGPPVLATSNLGWPGSAGGALWLGAGVGPGFGGVHGPWGPGWGGFPGSWGVPFLPFGLPPGAAVPSANPPAAGLPQPSDLKLGVAAAAPSGQLVTPEPPAQPPSGPVGLGLQGAVAQSLGDTGWAAPVDSSAGDGFGAVEMNDGGYLQ